MTYWKEYIKGNIIDPLDTLLECYEHGCHVTWDVYDLWREIDYLKRHGAGGAVDEALLPYMEEYLFHPQERMQQGDGKLSYFFRLWIDSYSKCYSELFKGHDLLELVETFAKYSTNDDERDHLFLHSLKSICLTVDISENGKIDWDDLYERTKFEMVNGVKDYNWARMTMLSMLMGVVMIKRQCQYAELEDTLKAYSRHWNFFGDCYSILLGKVVGSKFHHINAVVGQFAGGYMKDKAWAAKELISYCRKPLREGMTEKNWGKLCELSKRLLVAIDNIEQDYTLQPLFKIIFPKAECDSYAKAAPRLTALQIQNMLEEKERKIAERDKMIEDWKSKAENLERQVEELTETMRRALVEDLISIELLKEAILSYSAVIARTLFANLDWVLEGKNPAWNSHRDKLKQAIIDMEKEESAPKVTHITTNAYYESGATHDDHRNSISLEHKADDLTKKLIEKKKKKEKS